AIAADVSCARRSSILRGARFSSTPNLGSSFQCAIRRRRSLRGRAFAQAQQGVHAVCYLVRPRKSKATDTRTGGSIWGPAEAAGLAVRASRGRDLAASTKRQPPSSRQRHEAGDGSSHIPPVSGFARWTLSDDRRHVAI